MNSTIQIRIDEKTKKRADKTLKNIGLDLSSGIKVFLHQVIRSGSLPFVIRTENGFTPEYEKKMNKEIADALKQGKSFRSAKEVHDHILNS